MLTQIIFQSGDFYGQDLKSNIWEILGLVVTLLGIIAAAIVSILVIKMQQEAERRKEEKRLTDQERLIMDGLKSLRRPLESQIKTLKNLAAKLKRPEDLDHNPDVMVTLDSKALKETSYADLYQMFIIRKLGTNEEKAELFTKFNSITEYLKAFVSDYRTSFQYFQSKYEKYEQDWNKLVLEISRLRDKMLLIIKQSSISAQTQASLINLDTVFLSYIQVGNPLERYKVKQTLLSPLQVACRASNEPIATNFLWLINDALHASDNIDALKFFTRRGILWFAVKLNRTNKELARLVLDYERLKMAPRKNRTFWEILFTLWSSST